MRIAHITFKTHHRCVKSYFMQIDTTVESSSASLFINILFLVDGLRKNFFKYTTSLHVILNRLEHTKDQFINTKMNKE